MSETIRKSDDRKAILEKIVKDLNEGSDIQRAQKEFHRLIRDVSPEEIAELEQSLIQGGIPVEQVQKLCDVHVQVFKKALSRQPRTKPLAGHPVHTYRAENRETRRILKELKKQAARAAKGDDSHRLAGVLKELSEIEIHYRRKENQLFPFLESVGFTGPSKVMWGKHDEIRQLLKDVIGTDRDSGAGDTLKRKAADLARAVKRMIFMEERILFPVALRKLPDRAWAEIRRGEKEIGYAWTTPGNLWDPDVVQAAPPPAGGITSTEVRPSSELSLADAVPLEVGSLSPEQIDLMLKRLPLDITYVDKNDKVAYYSGGEERLFPRSPGIIGRSVQNCHPPKSVETVENILKSFRAREKDAAEFWMQMDGRFIHIRYFALYDEKGEYRGVIEMSQDVTSIRGLQGEKKLLDW